MDDKARYIMMSADGDKDGVVWYDPKKQRTMSDPPHLIDSLEYQAPNGLSQADRVKFFRAVISKNSGYTFFVKEDEDAQE